MEEKKPDLTQFKNIFNYVIYGLGAIVSVLYWSGNSKDTDLIESKDKQIENCEEQNNENRKTINTLLSRAYNLDMENKKKDTIIMANDSIAADELKKKAAPYLRNIKKLIK